MFPHTVTLYRPGLVIVDEKLNETIVNHVTVLEGVLLIASKAANVRATGLEGADAVNLHIPFNVKATDGVTGEPREYVDPIEGWKMADKSKVWTISIGMEIVKGVVVEPKAEISAIETKYDDVYRITKIDKIDFGSPDMQHWEVGGN